MAIPTDIYAKAQAEALNFTSKLVSDLQGLGPSQGLPQPSRATRSTSNQSSQSQEVHEAEDDGSRIHARLEGRVLVIGGLSQADFPNSPPRPAAKTTGTRSPRKPAKGLSPAKSQRMSLKRKRSATNASILNGTEDESRAGSPGSVRSTSGETATDEDENELDGLDAEAQASGGIDRAPMKRKRRKRGQRLLDQAALITREPSPDLPLIPEEDDELHSIDLPDALLSRSPTPDPYDPNDAATEVYKRIYEPLTKAEPFVLALTKINPAQRRTEKLFELAANTAKALRAWQDEYLEVDRLTAPHAPIPRKPATGDRQPLSPTLFEDLKESDIYDYVFDTKKIGHQDPIAQKIVRDASGRELRQRAPKTRVTADNQLMNANAANGFSEDENGRRNRARKPVSKYDGAPLEDGRRRKRGLGQVVDSTEFDSSAKRGRTSGRGRGSRRGRGGRGAANLLGKRIREMREASAVTATSAEDETASDVGMLDAPSREGSLAPSQADSQMDFEDIISQSGGKRKGRPPGSKNLHVRSDKGIPKGPRQPKVDNADLIYGVPSAYDPQGAALAAANGLLDDSPSKPQATTAKAANGKPPKSEKRSESMTIWWAKRKAAAAEAKAQAETDDTGQAQQPTKSKVKFEKIAQRPPHESPAVQQFQSRTTYAGPSGPGQPLHLAPSSQPPQQYQQYVPGAYERPPPDRYERHQPPQTNAHAQQSQQYPPPQQPPPPYQYQQSAHASSSYGHPSQSQYQPPVTSSYPPYSLPPSAHHSSTYADQRTRTLSAASPPTHHQSPVLGTHRDGRPFQEYQPRRPEQHHDPSRSRPAERYDPARDVHRPRESLPPAQYYSQPGQTTQQASSSYGAQPSGPPPPPQQQQTAQYPAYRPPIGQGPLAYPPQQRGPPGNNQGGREGDYRRMY